MLLSSSLKYSALPRGSHSHNLQAPERFLCGSHVASCALVAETQVWTVDRKWQESRWPPRTNPLVCEAERAERNSHQMQLALMVTLSLSTTEQGHTGMPQKVHPVQPSDLWVSNPEQLAPSQGTPASREISLNQSEKNRKHSTLPLAGQVKDGAGLCTGTHEDSVSAAQGQSILPCPFLMSQINMLIFNPKGLS